MRKLIKYEFLRRKKSMVSMLIVMLFIIGAILMGLQLGENWLIMSVALIPLLLFVTFIYPLLDAIIHYYGDFKQRGSMLFLTPLSGYSIIGAKVIVSIIILVSSIAITAAGSIIIYKAAQGIFPMQISIGLGELKTALSGLGISRNQWTWNIILVIFAMLAQYTASIVIALLSITIGRSLLSQSKFNWLYVVLFWFIVSSIIQFVNGIALAGSGFVGDMLRSVQMDDPAMIQVIKYITVGGIMYTIWIAGSILLSGRLINKKIDF